MGEFSNLCMEITLLEMQIKQYEEKGDDNGVKQCTERIKKLENIIEDQYCHLRREG